MQALLLLSILIGTIYGISVPASPSTSLLFRISQGGNGRFSSGIYGITLDNEKYVRDPFQVKTDFNDSSTPNDLSALENVTPDMVFEDRRGDFIYATARDDIFSGVPNVYVADKPNTCTKQTEPLHFRRLYTNLAFRSKSRANHDLTPTLCGWKCGWGPFSVDEDDFYAVVSGVFGTGSRLNHEIQLRRLRPECDKKLRAGNGFTEKHEIDIIECSELIAVVKRAPYNPEHAPTKVDNWAGSSLVVIPDSSDKHFIFQIYSSVNGENLVSLMRVSEKTGNVELLHRTKVPSSITRNRFKIKAIGSVDYKQGTLCWTMFSGLYCVDYKHTFPAKYVLNASKIESRITPNQIGQICKGRLLQVLSQTLTGVAIHKQNGQNLKVYFGCYAEIAGNGGLGELTISMLKQSLQPMVSNTASDLMAGSLMVMSPFTCDTRTTTRSTTSRENTLDTSKKTPTTTTTTTTTTTKPTVSETTPTKRNTPRPAVRYTVLSKKPAVSQKEVHSSATSTSRCSLPLIATFVVTLLSMLL